MGPSARRRRGRGAGGPGLIGAGRSRSERPWRCRSYGSAALRSAQRACCSGHPIGGPGRRDEPIGDRSRRGPDQHALGHPALVADRDLSVGRSAGYRHPHLGAGRLERARPDPTGHDRARRVGRSDPAPEPGGGGPATGRDRDDGRLRRACHRRACAQPAYGRCRGAGCRHRSPSRSTGTTLPLTGGHDPAPDRHHHASHRARLRGRPPWIRRLPRGGDARPSWARRTHRCRPGRTGHLRVPDRRVSGCHSVGAGGGLRRIGVPVSPASPRVHGPRRFPNELPDHPTGRADDARRPSRQRDRGPGAAARSQPGRGRTTPALRLGACCRAGRHPGSRL